MKTHALPSNWKLQRLEDLIAKFDAGVSVNGDDRPSGDGEFGVLKVSAVTEGIFRPGENKVISGPERIRACVNPKRDRLIMSRANTPEFVGATAYIDRDYPNVFLSDKLWQFEPHNGNAISMRWLGQVLASPAYRKRLGEIATGSSRSMKNISQEAVMRLELPVPPIEEQQRLALALLKWDAAIDKTAKLLAARQRSLAAVGHRLLTARRRLNGFTEAWPTPRADRIFNNVSIKGTANEPLLSVTQDRGVIPRDMLNGRVTMPSSGTDGFKLVEVGNFVISLRSFQGGLEHSAHRGLVSPAYTVLAAKQKLHARYFRHYFRSADFIKRLSVAVIGIRDGKQISFEDFCSIKLPFPTVKEQRAIAEVLDTAEQEIALLRKQLAALQQQKRALMQKLLTGQWRLKTPKKEAA